MHGIMLTFEDSCQNTIFRGLRGLKMEIYELEMKNKNEETGGQGLAE